MTEDEYEQLEKQGSAEIIDNEKAKLKKETRKTGKTEEKDEKLEPINIKMLQGAFYMLIIGYFFSGICKFIQVLNRNTIICFKQYPSVLKYIIITTKLVIAGE